MRVTQPTIAVVFLLVCGYASADIVNGVLTPGSPPPAPPPVPTLTPPPTAAIVNFDDVTAPCIFASSTGPLTSHYAANGVTFSGPTPTSGGVILNQCGNFSVSGHSPPNFLAFNIGAGPVLPGGGIATGPETITFARPVQFVQIDVGSTAAGTITLSCFAGPTLIGTATTTGASTLANLSVQGSAITRCTLVFTGSVLVADNLAFAVVVPTMSEYLLFALALTLAAIGTARLT